MELEQEELQAPVFSTPWENFYPIFVPHLLSKRHTSKYNFQDRAASAKGSLDWLLT